MIAKALATLPIGGTLFIVLPLPCIDNSRYFDKERFLSILKELGTEVKISHHTTRLAMYVFEKFDEVEEVESFPKKKMPGKGGKKNNFTIVIQ
jgi:25S rRNA (adenine2142-N1)-methyltransferase